MQSAVFARLESRPLALAALAALTGPARHGAARALAELTEAYGHDDVAQILHEWLDDRPGAA